MNWGFQFPDGSEGVQRQNSREECEDSPATGTQKKNSLFILLVLMAKEID